MHIRYFFLLGLLSQFSQGGRTQTVKNISNNNQLWLGYINQTRLSKKWGFLAEAHLRTNEDYINGLSQSVARVGLTYYANDNTTLSVGYAYINNFPGDNLPTISLQEHRSWQQIQWQNKYPRMLLTQRVRLEERFKQKISGNDPLMAEYYYAWRIRYNFLFMIPLAKKPFSVHSFSFVAGDELFVNFGKEIVYNYFDQNRFFVGFSYHINSHDHLQFGYMNLFQQLPAGNSYRNVDAARVFYFHNLDLRKKE